MRTRVALIKLAAIGDVALCCRALGEFVRSHETRLDLHWIIDKNLVGLAESLLGPAISPAVSPKVSVTWHPIDSAALFQGSALAKARESLTMLAAVLVARPEQTLLLHRDWRYHALVRPLVRQNLIGLSRERIPELAAYEKAFASLGRRTHAPGSLRSGGAAEAGRSGKRQGAQSGRIGILVGGARSSKVDFAEKRWPHMPGLVTRLLEKTQKQLVLFGGPEDRPLARQILAGCPGAASRIEDLVGALALAQIPEALSTLDAFVSIDSGLAHIASTVMTAPHQRVVTLFGPTDPRVWAPTASGGGQARTLYKARSCSPCYADDGRFNPCRFDGDYFQHCMKDITPEDVLKALS